MISLSLKTCDAVKVNFTRPFQPFQPSNTYYVFDGWKGLVKLTGTNKIGPHSNHYAQPISAWRSQCSPRALTLDGGTCVSTLGIIYSLIIIQPMLKTGLPARVHASDADCTIAITDLCFMTAQVF